MSRRKPFDDEEARALGQRLRELRGFKTQAEFAEMVGVDRASIANYESGRRIPNEAILKRIAEVSGAVVSEILVGRDKETSFNTYLRIANVEISSRMKERPGMIPRFMYSDDELSLIHVIRIALKSRQQLAAFSLMKEIVEFARKAVHESEQETGYVPFDAHYLDKLTARLKQLKFDEGYDPDADLAMFGP